MRTYEFTAAADGDIFAEDITATSEADAQAAAVLLINAAWGRHYETWDDLAPDTDVCELIGHPAIMAPRLPLATVTAYRALADGLSDMVEEGRLQEGDVPDDYQWLADKLATIAGLDPA